MKKFLIAALIFIPILFSNSCASYAGKIAYANFSDFPGGSIDTDGYNINGEGWDSNNEHKNALRLLKKGAFFSLQFYVDEMPENAVLLVEHASDSSPDCSNSGYSPITIKINDNIVVSNFSPLPQSYSTKRWNISNLLRTGENVISWTAGNLCSSYLLKNWTIFDNGQHYYSGNYFIWSRDYYPKRYYLYRFNRNKPANIYRYYGQKKKRNEPNNQQRYYENRKKPGDRKNQDKR